MTIRTLGPDDVDLAFDINAHGIDVDDVERPMFDRLIERSIISLAAIDASGEMVGFCLVTDTRDGPLPPRSQWAIDREGAVLHIERVAFRPEGSGRGLGVEIFDELDERVAAWARSAATERTPLTTMVKVEPPNEHGRTFFGTRGFTEIDRRVFGDETWALLQRHYPG